MIKFDAEGQFERKGWSIAAKIRNRWAMIELQGVVRWEGTVGGNGGDITWDAIRITHTPSDLWKMRAKALMHWAEMDLGIEIHSDGHRTAVLGGFISIVLANPCWFNVEIYSIESQKCRIGRNSTSVKSERLQQHAVSWKAAPDSLLLILK